MFRRHSGSLTLYCFNLQLLFFIVVNKISIYLSVYLSIYDHSYTISEVQHGPRRPACKQMDLKQLKAVVVSS